MNSLRGAEDTIPLPGVPPKGLDPYPIVPVGVPAKEGEAQR